MTLLQFKLTRHRLSARRLSATVALLLALLTCQAAAETIQLKKHPGGGYTIAGRINDAVSLTFILDTGASDVSIPDEVARELERAGKLDRGDFIGTRTYVLADGSKVPSRRVLLRELTIGGQTVSNVTASIGRSGSPPLLGQSFLSKFASWTLDNER
ncbi:MAG: TIGR02281 family clan AA aspartic protease, partial [Alphaproteobacteria bacterium]